MQLRSLTITVLFLVLSIASAQAQSETIAYPAKTTFTRLGSFNGANGSEPYGGLAQGTDGNFYGTTAIGGPQNYGTVFKITPSGKLTTLYSFCSQALCADGGMPWAGLILGTDGNLYGTTVVGGAYGNGEVFKITSNGKLTTVYSFCAKVHCPDGSGPEAALVQGTDGNFYGTTIDGGSNYSGGTIFKVTPKGTLTTLYNFCSQANCSDGQDPQAALVQGMDGNFYGITQFGGANKDGTVFKITAKGALTTLYSFCTQSKCADGADPYGSLVQGTDGNFYGTTASGGGPNNSGTIFKVTSHGALTTLYTFCLQSGCADGAIPYTGLVQATDGNFYGATLGGGAPISQGTAFEITPAGTLTTLYKFCNRSKCTDGAIPRAGLAQSTNGTFYGTTRFGGADSSGCGGNGCGAVFGLSVGLGPFVQTVPTSGKVGAKVVILGNNLTGSTAVSFDGTPATFTVVSSTEIKAIVPTGATTGFVTVTTPGGKLTSNVVFRVR